MPRPSSSASTPVERDAVPASQHMSFEVYARTTELTVERVPLSGMPDECGRVRLIADLARVAQLPEMPADMREASLKLIGWLARRLPNELPHGLGTLPPPPPAADTMPSVAPPPSSRLSSSKPPSGERPRRR